MHRSLTFYRDGLGFTAGEIYSSAGRRVAALMDVPPSGFRGQVDAGLAIYDTMHLIQPQVATTCIGMAASMGAVLLAGGLVWTYVGPTEAEPAYADGWLNVARALIQEGETEAAKPFLAKALELNRELGRIWFFQAAVQKADGDYDGALKSLAVARSKYPRDRVVLNQMGRLLFLKREYAAALKVLQQVCAVDPEDVQMHYTMMLCYRGLGDQAGAAREEERFQREWGADPRGLTGFFRGTPARAADLVDEFRSAGVERLNIAVRSGPYDWDALEGFAEAFVPAAG